MFVDDLGMAIKVDYDMKTREEAKAYYDKLCNVLGEKYPLHYYEVISDEEYKLDYKAYNDLEKIIKITLLNEKENKDRLCISLISVDLSNVKGISKTAYKEIFKQLRKENAVLQE